MDKRSTRTIYTYFNRDKNIIDIALKGNANNEGMKQIFKKRWGPFYVDGIHNRLTNEEQVLFEQYASLFEKLLNQIEHFKKEGYTDKEIIESLFYNKPLPTKTNNVSIPKYASIEAIAKHFGTTVGILKQALGSYPDSSKLAYQLYYGINREKKPLEEIAEMFNVNKSVICNSIVEVDKNLDKYVKQIEENQSKQAMNYQQSNFFDSFPIKYREFVGKLLLIYHEKGYKGEALIRKLYGPHYDYLDRKIILSQNDYQLKNFLMKRIKDAIEKVENGKAEEEVLRLEKGDNIVKPKRTVSPGKQMEQKRKEHFLDYFEENEKDSVIKVLKKYENNKPKYFELISKLYPNGEIDRNIEASLSEQERKIWNNIIFLFKQELKQVPVIEKNPIEYPSNVSGLEEIILSHYPNELNKLSELGITKENIDFCLIKYLDCFKKQIPFVLQYLVQSNIKNIEYLKENLFMQNFLSSLTKEEKAYFYLRLESIVNPALTDLEIASRLQVNIRTVTQYEPRESEELKSCYQYFKKIV